MSKKPELPQEQDRAPTGPEMTAKLQEKAVAQEALRARVALASSVEADLKASGITAQDMQIRQLGAPEKAATNTAPSAEGYVIPYFSSTGAPLPFYRVKILNASDGIKYRQPRRSTNHVYYPPGFAEALNKMLHAGPYNRFIILTEGEKKAACAVRYGLPAAAFGGVDSWRSKTIELPSDTELYTVGAKKTLRAKLPASSTSVPEEMLVANGFSDLVDLLIRHQLCAVIIYDTDVAGGLKSEVQRAATMLAYELRYLGVRSDKIKLLVLPIRKVQGEDPVKAGLDDFIAPAPIPAVAWLKKQLDIVSKDPKAFPRHPNPKGFINTQLDGVLTRRGTQQIASVILAELDARGLRLRDSHTAQPFYYDSDTHKLMSATLVDGRGELMHETRFGTLLYQQFGLSGNDTKVLKWLASQFTGDEPIYEVRPRRVCALITEKEDPRNPYGIALQVSDSHFIAVSPDDDEPIKLHVNGTHSLLFEQNQVDPLDIDRVMELFEEMHEYKTILPCWWLETLEQTNLGLASLADDEVRVTDSVKDARAFAAMLFYISPFLNRWRGLQLPFELMLGEAGSGKSSLYNLRLTILTGRPQLRNLPTDLRDWHASITNAGGLHVVDNVNIANRELRQRISDEICRLVTEPQPVVEMRQLYTNNTLLRLPVSSSFAMTAITMPFSNADLIQRSAIFEMAALGSSPDGDWVQKQLSERGGREAWVAHHLLFLHRFLKVACQESTQKVLDEYSDPEEGVEGDIVRTEGWDADFKTIHRLAHLEQSLRIAANIFGLNADSISGTILNSQGAALVEADWTMTAIKEYIQEVIDGGGNLETGIRFNVADIASWAEGHSEYSTNRTLTNTRALGKYMLSHRRMLRTVLFVRQGHVINNRIIWIRDNRTEKDVEKALKTRSERVQKIDHPIEKESPYA